jgi:hypothetical protein
MRCRYPWPLKVVRFVKNNLSFNQLNIWHADIPCVLDNDVREAARSTQPVTLYITVNIIPPNLYNSPPSIPANDDDCPAEEATIPGRIQFPTPEHLLPLSDHQPVEAGNTMPQSQEEMSPGYSTKNLHRADEAMKQIVPINQSDTWERAVGRIKWVMDTLGPIAEVRVIPFDVLD